MVSIDELFDKMMKDSPKKKPKKKAAPKADPLQEAVQRAVRNEKTKAREARGYQSGNGTDYVKVWNDDGTDYTYITKARFEMGKILGRPVADHEAVFFRDRNAKGEAKFAEGNLILGFKKGVSLDLLTCANCGCRGNWTTNSIPDGEQRGTE